MKIEIELPKPVARVYEIYSMVRGITFEDCIREMFQNDMRTTMEALVGAFESIKAIEVKVISEAEASYSSSSDREHSQPRGTR